MSKNYIRHQIERIKRAIDSEKEKIFIMFKLNYLKKFLK